MHADVPMDGVKKKGAAFRRQECVWQDLNNGIRSEFVNRIALVLIGAQFDEPKQSLRASAKSSGTFASAISFSCVPKVFSSYAFAACKS
jgi:hypothetical protein